MSKTLSIQYKFTAQTTILIIKHFRAISKHEAVSCESEINTRTKKIPAMQRKRRYLTSLFAIVRLRRAGATRRTNEGEISTWRAWKSQSPGFVDLFVY